MKTEENGGGQNAEKNSLERLKQTNKNKSVGEIAVFIQGSSV